MFSTGPMPYHTTASATLYLGSGPDPARGRQPPVLRSSSGWALPHPSLLPWHLVLKLSGWLSQAALSYKPKGDTASSLLPFLPPSPGKQQFTPHFLPLAAPLQ